MICGPQVSSVLPVPLPAQLGAVVLALARTWLWSELLIWEQHFDLAAVTPSVRHAV